MKRPLLVLVGAALLSSSIHGGTVSQWQAGRTSSYETVGVRMGSGAASLGSGTIAGMGQWNAAPCANLFLNPYPYPRFQFDASINPLITVNRVNGFSSIADNTVCAKFGGPLDGTSATITLYDRLRVSGSDFSCDIDNFDVLSDRIAHELGHYLNLANTGLCSGIMGNNQAFLSNGQLSWDSSRLILTSECSLADFLAFTEYEQELAQCQSDPEPCTGTSPILIDLDRNQFHLSGSAVEFDIDADGELESIAWTAPEQDDGFLCLDRNGNGVIDDGGELFGDATRMLAGHTAAHGYIALGELDEETYGGNLDGAITPEDAMFEELRVWLDRNHDGVSQPEELLTLEEAGVLVLEFNFEWSPRTDGIGNEFKLLADALIVWRDQIQGTKTTDVFLKLNP